jgi:3-oxoacyl-(acyl-carrier-protein) synthase
MSKLQIINILGGSWVTASGFGRLSEKQKFKLDSGLPQIPKAKEIFSEPLTRYGRFDQYTKLGCAAIALALKDSGLDESKEKRPIGVIVSTVYECFESDLAFYETTKEEDGFFSSPNLFSYTLPGIVIGEAAIYFKLNGPTFTVGDTLNQKGRNALITGLNLLNSDVCDTVVAGWLDGPNEMLNKFESGDDQKRGAIFFVLSSHEQKNANKRIYLEKGSPYFESGKEIQSVVDLME